MIFHQAHNSVSNYKYNAFFYTDKIWEHHFHKNPEIIYVMKGAVDCIINNTAYCLTEGDFGLCLPYDIHRYAPQEDTLYWVLVFSEDYIRYLSKQISGKTGTGFRFQCKKAVEDFVKEQLVHNEAPTTLSMKSALYAIFEEYLNQVTLIDKSSKERQVVSFISDYVQEHHTQELTLADLAQKLGYDYSYMSRFFHNTFNMTFTDFVNIYRLETAITLLENTDESITSIAFKSGFQSVRTFNDFFKKNAGASPSQYRRSAKQ